MKKQLTFEDVCKQLKKNKDFSDVIDDLSVLSGATILLLGVRSASGDISAFLNALIVKDQLIDIGKCILSKIIKGKSNECDKRITQIQWAYSVIYYTSYFDVLDEKMPAHIRRAIALSLSEKKSIFQEAVLEENKREDLSIEKEIFFPNIVDGYANIEKHLLKLYKSLCEGLSQFVHKLAFEESSSERDILEFNDILKKLPQLAIERFKGQYLYLASNFNEFYVYMHIEGEKIKQMHIEELYKNIISIGCNTNTKIDVGLENLEKILLDLPEKIHEEKIKDIVNNLIENYKNDIEKPIIDSKDERLKYPSINRAFIPQSYKILQYSGKEKLEKKETWYAQDECNDMDSFWARYYVSHHSLENLLLILGEPGGGKSLLTKIVCARMSDQSNIFVRIPLREVSVEKDIEDIVCEQIQKDGDVSEQLPTYKWFAENFKHNPITLVFDGYDEVLQATGGVYRNFLMKLLRFQEQCTERHRPVRVVVTSRETLIDKAEIPVGAIVMKLLEFNDKQREEWIRIWNLNNEEVYKRESIKSFMLPKDNRSIEELSRQPLLLLMLAIYDANLEEGTNSLGQEENLNRTKLYNELLRRFIRRELRKGPRGNEISYEECTEEDQDVMVNLEMEKLGIAALGMFVRGKLSLKIHEMERDLLYMGAQIPTYEKIGKMLTNAEGFFGSFFFIHDSQSGNTDTDDKEVAFEFLHKTFYEFLVADLVLKYLIRAMDELDALKNSKRCDSFFKAIEDPNHFEKQYYTALMNAYLCSEPEIIEMIVEWKENVINDCFQGDRLDYDRIIDELFKKQIEMLCSNIFMPQIWIEHNNLTVKSSYMQYCATYFMNLLILQTITKKDDKNIIRNKDWIYISQFWKMNIQEDVLLKFTSLFSISTENDGVCIKKKEILDKVEQKKIIEKQKDIFNFLQDDISYSLYSLHDVGVRHDEKQKYRRCLLEKGVNIQFEEILGRINEYILRNNPWFSIETNIENALQILRNSQADASVVLDWILCVNNYLDKVPYRVLHYRDGAGELIELVIRRYPMYTSIITEILRFGRKIGYIDLMTGRTSFGKMFLKVAYDKPVLLLEFLDLFEFYLSKEDRDTIINRLRGMLYNIDSIDLVSKILKKIYTFNMEMKDEHLLEAVVQNADQLYVDSPKTMIDIIQLCFLYGKKEEVEYLVKKGCENIERLSIEQPELVVDLLEIIYMSGEGHQVVERLIAYVERECETIIYKNPKIILETIKIISVTKNFKKCRQLVFRIYKRFDVIFNADPKEAIIFLRITERVINQTDRINALKFSIEAFDYLLLKSLDAALDLLILSKNVILNRCKYIQICLHNILNGNTTVDTIKLLDLVQDLKENELDQMSGFFWNSYLQIIMKYPKLAKMLAESYSNSLGNEKFTDVLSVYRRNLRPWG